ncbi:MAG: STAS domain-containing protein [Bacillati bacterium ANGP1]|uniref:STAS domain-containing protein n=1 Tax=Candidatus Segetimicrobium genomatis TaxID=2569760 RepID=A0A537J0A8_9BACT|nr:MAG: STAS domain-containing protein [Terrabacteria group bacterium ANGP1]
MTVTAMVKVIERGGVPIAAPEGEIDLANVADCRAQLIAVVPNTAPGLVVDLSQTTYLDSRGVHLILELAERLRVSQQQLALVVPERSVIRRVLLLTQVDQTVPLHRTLDDALQQFQ